MSSERSIFRSFNQFHSLLFVNFLMLLLMASASLFYASGYLHLTWSSHGEKSAIIQSDQAFVEDLIDSKLKILLSDFRDLPDLQPTHGEKSAIIQSDQAFVEDLIDSKLKILLSDFRVLPDLQPTTQPVSSNPPSSEEVQLPKQPELRRSLLIYGADRSGTTFTTKMFSEDPQILTVYEPLWITSEWNKEDRAGVEKWKQNILDMLKGILSCHFSHSQAGTRFLSRISRKWSGAFVKNPFISPAFCNGTCQDLSKIPDYADEVCLTKYKHSVTKIGEPRMPHQLISSVLPAVLLENPDTDIRVIQLVRDPRGSFNSRIKLHWMIDFHNEGFPRTANRVCSNFAENIKFGRSLGKWQDKYLEVHYRDLAEKPIETTKKMYKFAGFEMSQEILDWVVKNTSPTKEQMEKEASKTFSSVRNSSANVDKWREESPIERVRIIEQECEEVFELMKLEKMT